VKAYEKKYEETIKGAVNNMIYQAIWDKFEKTFVGRGFHAAP